MRTIEAGRPLGGRKPDGQPLTIEYFLDRAMPEPNSGCWIWMKATQRGGSYGVLRDRGGTCRAHRRAYEVANNCSVLSHVDVCHRCDNRLCVNPDHLFLGSRLENMRDCISKGRFKHLPVLAGDRSPHAKLSADDVRAIRSDSRSSRALAVVYGVNRSTIGFIRAGHTWRGVI